MPVVMRLALRDGWKAEENKRFGKVLEVRFVDDKDQRILFRYAPCLEDRAFFIDMFDKLRAYDEKVIALRDFMKMVDSRSLPPEPEGVQPSEPQRVG